MNPTNSANIQSVLSQLRQYQAIAEGNNVENLNNKKVDNENGCLLYTSPSPRDRTRSRMPSSA